MLLLKLLGCVFVVLLVIFTIADDFKYTIRKSPDRILLN